MVVQHPQLNPFLTIYCNSSHGLTPLSRVFLRGSLWLSLASCQYMKTTTQSHNPRTERTVCPLHSWPHIPVLLQHSYLIQPHTAPPNSCTCISSVPCPVLYANGRSVNTTVILVLAHMLQSSASVHLQYVWGICEYLYVHKALCHDITVDMKVGRSTQPSNETAKNIWCSCVAKSL